MTHNISRANTLVDTTIGARLLLAFVVSPLALQRRPRLPWQLSSMPASYVSALGLNEQNQSNLMLVFNELVLNQDGRGSLVRLVADRPTFPLWAALDPSILRIYQEDTLLEVVRNDATGINRVRREMFHLTVPELADLFDESEQFVGIIANPHYARKTFSSGVEYEEQ